MNFESLNKAWKLLRETRLNHPDPACSYARMVLLDAENYVMSQIKEYMESDQ